MNRDSSKLLTSLLQVEAVVTVLYIVQIWNSPKLARVMQILTCPNESQIIQDGMGNVCKSAHVNQC